jgi:cobyrinic acid a,c-diamide synthase
MDRESNMNQKHIKGLVIAGTHSGVGKTTITLGVLAALKQRGIRVAPFKVGPDFIDPGHHQAVCGSASRNLDGWMLSAAYNRACLAGRAAEADLVVVEGVMGLFDGFSGRDESGSTAQMAKWLGLPVLLVVDGAGMARSAAALVQGFENFDPAVRYAGVLFNNLGSPGHLAYLQDALHGYVRMPCLGGLVRDEALTMPERHLGLVTAGDHALSGDRIDHLASWMERQLDLNRLLDGLPAIDCPAGSDDLNITVPAAPCVNIAVARDRAFCFYYQDNLDLLARAGARLMSFSPLSDRQLPQGIDGIYLGGGYPELHAAQLARNAPMREAILTCSRDGMPIYGECGGLMYLGRELSDPQGQVYPMTGCLPLSSCMHQKLNALGYREVTLARDCIIGPIGLTARGHEFHYSDLQDASGRGDMDLIYDVNSRRGAQPSSEGYRCGQTLGSYIHLHFGSNPALAPSLVQSCRAYRQSVANRVRAELGSAKEAQDD